MTFQKPKDIQDTAAQIAALIQALALNAEGVQSSKTRHVVEQVLGSMMAAYKSGISFEKLSIVFQQGGISIAPSTLRRHYFEAKAKMEIAKHAERSAAKILKARKALAISKHSEMERQQLDEMLNLPKPIVQQPLVKTGKREALTNPSPGLIQQSVSVMVEQETPRTTDAPLPLSVNNNAPTSSNHSEARSVDEIEMASNATEERTPVTEDLLVIDGKVLTASNKPFLGTLTRKQIYVLRQNGKIVGQTMIGSTSKDFVQMRAKL